MGSSAGAVQRQAVRRLLTTVPTVPPRPCPPAQATVASQTVLSDNISKLLAGDISLDTFKANTAPAQLQEAAAAAKLPGTPPGGQPPKKRANVALAVGLSVGLSLPAVLAMAGTGYWYFFKKPTRSSGLSMPML